MSPQSTTTAQAPIQTLVDNRPGNSLLEAIRRLMQESVELDVATGYFEIGSLLDLDGTWQQLRGMRLLMGDEATRRTKQAFVEALRNRQANGIERTQEHDDWKALQGLEAIYQAFNQGGIQAKVYTRAKFHAKAYHFKTGGVVNHGIIGSSNFTHPGLTQNIELNLFTSDNTHLGEVARWYQQAWEEAEDLKPELLQLIEPHIHKYFPFEVYVQAMREYFRDRDSDQSGWEKTDSHIYPLLATYQRDAYHDLMEMAAEHGGALLCDGVGLGKTYVGLMLIERARMERQKVLVIAPKSAIPSVWARNLSKYFPDDFGKYTDDIRVLPHTEFGRHGGITEDQLERLRQRYETIIVDEAHHFRMPFRNRSKRLKALTKDRRTFLLTATPINNSLLDLYNLINYIAQDNPRHFSKLGVNNLRGWFTQRMEEDHDDHQLKLIEDHSYQDFLKHLIVQRSRRYVKSLEAQEDESVKFPTREKPVVIDYSLEKVYGTMLPDLLTAFDANRARLKLVLYETEKFKEENKRDKAALNDQSQVVGLVRTMLLKRLESSQKALEASVEDLLLKHVALLKDLQPLKFADWEAEYAELWKTLQEHRAQRFGEDEEDEENEALPLTTYELKKLSQIRDDQAQFGNNQVLWMEALIKDIKVLSDLLYGLYQVTKPENDAKLAALIQQMKASSGLSKNKVVLFSEFKDTARYLEEQLKKHFNPKEIVEVDSGRNVKGREKVIQRFAPYYNCETDQELAEALNDPIRILISTDVLSEGLNLQDANQIINYDLHWNPVRLMQRIGRVDRRMDPNKPVDYESVYVYNFLPPAELDRILGLYQRVSGKLIAINRTLGIEAPVLTADDDFKAMDFFQNLGDFTMSPQERVRLEAHELEAKHPELWARSQEFPNRIYSGKSSGSKLFLAYRVVTGYDADDPEKPPLTDVKWIMIDRETEKITEELEEIHAAIQCAEATPRATEMPESERTRLRKKVEAEVISAHRFRAGVPAQYRDELICWMEV